MKTPRITDVASLRSPPAYALLLLLLLAQLPTNRAEAQHVANWQGDAILGNEWSRLGNWAQLIRPDNDGDDSAFFVDGGGYHTVLIDEPSRIKNIHISDTQTYLFSGSQLTLVDGGITMSGAPSANHGFLNPIRFEGNSGSIENKSPAQLTLTGDVSLAVSHSVGVINNAGSPVQIRGRISGTVVFFGKSGEGLLRLDNSNTYIGETSINGGTLRTGVAGALGVGSVYISGGVLDLDGLDTTLGPGANTDSGVKFVDPGGSILLGGTDNTLTISTLGVWIDVYSGGSSTIEGGRLNLATSTATREIRFQLADDRLRIDSSIQGGGLPSSAPSLLKSGPGHLTLGGANAFTRALRVTGGTLILTHAGALGSTGAAHGTILDGGGLVLDLPPGSAAIAESLVFGQPARLLARDDCTWTGPVTISSIGAEWSVDDGATLVVAGVVSGGSEYGVRKTGAGTLHLTGDMSAYTGAMVVEAGALDARGTFGGAVTLESEGALRTGDGASFGALTTPSLAAGSGTGIWLDVGGGELAGLHDRIDVGGTAELAGTLRVTAHGEAELGDSFTLLTWFDRVGDFDEVELPVLADSTLSWQVDYEPSALRLFVSGPATTAPEHEQTHVVRLRAPAPNPTGRATSLRYDLARAGRVDLVVYDVRGRRVAAVVDGAYLDAGSHVAHWNAHDDRGRAVASGAYFVQLHVDGAPAGETRRLVVRR